MERGRRRSRWRLSVRAVWCHGLIAANSKRCSHTLAQAKNFEIVRCISAMQVRIGLNQIECKAVEYVGSQVDCVHNSSTYNHFPYNYVCNEQEEASKYLSLS
jgi:hypothetical protein